MHNIMIREWNGKTIRHRADKYFSLTDMANATGKLVGNWRRLKDTEEYLECLSIDTGLSISVAETETESRYSHMNNALIDTVQGGVPELQGTWGHELVAIEFGRWCDKNLGIQCNKWVYELLDKGSVSLATEEKPVVTAIPTYTNEWYRLQEAKATCELADLIWGKSPIDELLKSGVKANIVSKSHPALKSACEEMKTLLPMTIKAQLVTVTGIAELLTKESGVSFSARSLNTFLTNKGFQTRDVGREPPYMPTEKGKDFSEIVLQVANGCEKAVHQLRWFTTLVDELLPLILSSPNGK